MTYEETIERLEHLHTEPFLPSSKVGLDRIRFFLEVLGNPHQTFAAAHIAGSSGKGSTTSLLAGAFQAAGKRTGCFRSPHLESYRERIAIEGTPISPDAWVEHFTSVWPIVETMRANRLPGYTLGRPTVVEVLFVLMSLYFRDSAVEWAAVETGLGGRLDATNTLSSEVAAITNISLEHTQLLGSTVAEIAGEKAAIIKAGARAVTASHDPAALDVIRARSAEVGAPLWELGRDFSVEVQTETFQGMRCLIRVLSTELDAMLPLAGHFQALNAATACAAAVAWREQGFTLSDTAIVQGLESVRIPGRFEVVSIDPLIVLDGAHNPDAVANLRDAFVRLAPDTRPVVLFAGMKDKNLAAMAAALAPLASQVVVTTVPGTDRASRPDSVAGHFSANGVETSAIADVDQALAEAIYRGAREGALLVTGSMYLVGYARQRLSSSGSRQCQD